MPEVLNTSGPRKVRCPKCTARLTEPPTLIYQCPICSTLLLAKGNHDDLRDRSFDDKLGGNVRDSKVSPSPPEGNVMVEKTSAKKETIQIQGHRGLGRLETDEMPEKDRSRPSCADFQGKAVDNGVLNYVHEDPQSAMLDERSHQMRKYQKPKPLQTETFTRKVDSLSSELSPYTLRWRSSAPSSVKSFGSSDKSEQGKFLSGCKSPSYDGSETEYDFPASSSESFHVEELLETTSSIIQIERNLLEDQTGEAEVPVRSEENELEFRHDEIDNRGGAQKDLNSQVVEDHLDLHSREAPGSDGSIINGTGELDHDTVSSDDVDESFVDSDIDHHPSSATDCRRSNRLRSCSKVSSVRNDCRDEFKLSGSDLNYSKGATSIDTGRSQCDQTELSVLSESVVNLNASLSDDLPLEVVDSEHHDGLEGKLTDSEDLTMLTGNHNSINTLQSPSNTMTPETFKYQIDDGPGDQRREGSKGFASCLSQQERDNGIEETSPCDADILSDRLVKTEVCDSLDMPDCDTESVQQSNGNALSREKCLEADSVHEKGVNAKTAAVAGVLLKDEHASFSTPEEAAGISVSHLHQKTVSVIQNQTRRGMNNSDSSNSIIITDSEAHVEKSAVNDKIFQGTKEEFLNNTQQDHLVTELEASLGSDPFVGEFQSCNPPTTDKIDQSDLAIMISDRHWVNYSDNLPSGLEKLCRDSVSPGWRENPVTTARTFLRRDERFKEEVTSKPSQGGNRAVVQENILAEQRNFHDMSSGSVFGPGHWSRSSHQKDTDFLSPERMQMNDSDGKVSAIWRHQKPRVGLGTGSYVAPFNSDGKVLYAQQGKYLNPEFCVQPHSLHGIWQGHGTHLQSPRFQAEQRAMEHGSHCLFCVPASTVHGYSERHDEGIPHFHPDERYLSSMHGLSSSTCSGMAYPFQVASQGVILPATVHGQVFSHCAQDTGPPVCAFCMQQSQIQQPMPQNQMQHHCTACLSKPAPIMTHQPASSVGWESWAHQTPLSSYSDCPVGLCQTSLLSPDSVRHNRSDVQLQPHALLVKKQKRYPPLPVQGAAPYVLCQNCNQLLQVPANLPTNSENFQKLRCGLCGKVSRFSIHIQVKVQSSNMSLVTNSMGQVMSIPHSATSTVHKSSMEVSTDHPVHGPSFLSDGDGQWLQISNATQNVVAAHQQASVGIADSPPFDKAEKEPLRHHDVYQNQLKYGGLDNFLSSSGMPSEYYLSSLPSSRGGSGPQGNASGCQATESQNAESTFVDQDKSSAEALTFSNHHDLDQSSEIIKKLSHMGFHHSLPMQRSEYSANEPFLHEQTSTTVKSLRQMESDFSRSTSESSAAQLSKCSAAPCSPLSESVDHAGDPNRTHAHQDVTGVRSAPWSPAPGSPLYDHLLHDALSDFDEKSLQKDQDAERARSSRGRKYFTGLIKRGFKDFGKVSHGNNNRSRVMVNGRLICASDVKRAEEQAGSIHPGSYWYDYRAGFWGTMGGQCQGIIPPFIEEFDYPLAKDCSGGRTGVLVNGRELHEKDLEVLARRGLPITPGKAYVVDISGRVVDHTSGERLSLGKLAPTVEQKGCGHGMFQQSAVQLGAAHGHIQGGL